MIGQALNINIFAARMLGTTPEAANTDFSRVETKKVVPSVRPQEGCFQLYAIILNYSRESLANVDYEE